MNLASCLHSCQPQMPARGSSLRIGAAIVCSTGCSAFLHPASALQGAHVTSLARLQLITSLTVYQPVSILLACWRTPACQCCPAGVACGMADVTRVQLKASLTLHAGSDLAKPMAMHFQLPCSPRLDDRLLHGGCGTVARAAGTWPTHVSVQAVTRQCDCAGLQQGGQWAPVLWHPTDQHPEQPHHPICQGRQPVPGRQCQPREGHVCAGGPCGCIK